MIFDVKFTGKISCLTVGGYMYEAVPDEILGGLQILRLSFCTPTMVNDHHLLVECPYQNWISGISLRIIGFVSE